MFNSADAAYVLAYSVIMLTTDLHSSQVSNPHSIVLQLSASSTYLGEHEYFTTESLVGNYKHKSLKLSSPNLTILFFLQKVIFFIKFCHQCVPFGDDKIHSVVIVIEDYHFIIVCTLCRAPSSSHIQLYDVTVHVAISTNHPGNVNLYKCEIIQGV